MPNKQASFQKYLSKPNLIGNNLRNSGVKPSLLRGEKPACNTTLWNE